MQKNRKKSDYEKEPDKKYAKQEECNQKIRHIVVHDASSCRAGISYNVAPVHER
jgi:hypothetical protein